MGNHSQLLSGTKSKSKNITNNASKKGLQNLLPVAPELDAVEGEGGRAAAEVEAIAEAVHPAPGVEALTLTLGAKEGAAVARIEAEIGAGVEAAAIEPDRPAQLGGLELPPCPVTLSQIQSYKTKSLMVNKATRVQLLYLNRHFQSNLG